MYKRALTLLSVISLLFLVSASYADARKPGPEVSTKTSVTADYPNASLLATGQWLQENIKSKNMVIIDARSSGYDTGHIPGAIRINYNDFKTQKGLKPQAELEKMLSDAGLTRDMKFAVYDDTTASFGAAGRIFWMLEYLGCDDVHILNGGWDKWSADGRPKETIAVKLPPAKFTAALNKDTLATSSHILSRMRDKDFAILDSRTDEEFNGWQYYGEARGGHIPGAVSISYAWMFTPEKTVPSYTNLRKIFESRGITSDKEVVSYCTAGIRSGYSYFLLRLMGYPRCSNYDGSMLEWSADPNLPMEKMANYSRLVSPKWVKDLIDGKEVPNAPKGPLSHSSGGLRGRSTEGLHPGRFLHSSG